MIRIVTIAAIVTALAPGCRTIEHSIDEPDPFDAGTGGDTDSDADTDTDGDTDTDTDGDTDTDTDTDTDSDTDSNTGTGSDTSPVVPCTAVDILFVVQSAGTELDDFQSDLATAIPGFVSALWDELPTGTSVHAGITTADFCVPDLSYSVAYLNCVPDGDTIAQIPDHYDPPMDTDSDTDSDTEADAGVNGAQGRLFVHEENAYFSVETSVGGGDDALASWLASAIEAIGYDSCGFCSFAAGAGYAAHPVNAAHNEGFFRDEGAVLLIVVVGDFPDVSLEVLTDYEAMIAGEKAVCGVDACTLSAALIGPSCYEDPPSPYSPAEFLELFGESPLLGDANEPINYPLVLGGDLAQQVAQTCDAIGPG